jgi:hypothetical protein
MGLTYRLGRVGRLMRMSLMDNGMMRTYLMRRNDELRGYLKETGLQPVYSQIWELISGQII